jgi:hypothetical protein
VEMSESSSIKFVELDREIDSVQGDEGNKEGIDNATGEQGVEDSLNCEGDEVRPNGELSEQGNTAVEGKGKGKLGIIQDKYPDDLSCPSDTDEEKEDAKYLAVRKDKKDLELSTGSQYFVLF